MPRPIFKIFSPYKSWEQLLSYHIHYIYFICKCNIMEEAREKKYLEIPLSKILKFRPYRRLLFCIYILFSHDEITIEEIQQKLNSPETFEDFKKLWWISISYLMEKETLITFENWKRCVADNPSVIEFLYNHRRDRTFPGL